MWLSLGYILLAFIPLIAGCESTDFSSRLERAKQYQVAGKLSDALIELKAAVQAKPDDPDARRLLGMVHLATGDNESAEKELERALSLGVPVADLHVALTRARLLAGKTKLVVELAEADGSSADSVADSLAPHERAELYALNGHAYLESGKLEDAAASYRKALAEDTNNAEAGLGMASIAAASGDLQEAVALLEKVLIQAPDFARGWSYLGVLQQHDKNASAAEAAYTRALDAGSTNLLDRVRRAFARISLQRYPDAEQDLALVERRLGNIPDTLNARGLIALRGQEYRVAKDRFIEALRLEPSNLTAIYYLGLTTAVLGMDESAEEYLRTFLEKRPGLDETSGIARKALAQVRAVRRDFTGAEEVLAPVVEQYPQDTEALRLMADINMQLGQPESAVKWLQQTLASGAGDERTYLKLGMGMLAVGNSSGAEEVLNLVSGDKNAQQEAQRLLFQSHLVTGQIDKALEIAEKFRLESPQSPLPDLMVGLAHLSSGAPSKAREAFEQSLVLSPGFFASAHNLAQLELSEGKVERARELYLEAQKVAPENPLLPVQMAKLEMQAGRWGEVQSWLERAVELSPDALAPRILLTRQYLRSGENNKALATIRLVSAENKDKPDYLFTAATAEMAAGLYAEAATKFEQLLDIEPGLSVAHYALARCRAELGDDRGVQQSLEAALKADPDNLVAEIARVRLQLIKGEFEDAKSRIDVLVGQHPSEVEVLVLRAELATRNERHAEAVVDYRQALELQPSPQRALTLAQSQWRAGDKDAAIQTLEDWIGAHPGDPRLIHTLAESYNAVGDEAKARDTYHMLVNLYPESATAHNSLAWSLREFDLSLATQHAKRAQSLDPKNPAILDTLGVLALRDNQPKQAIFLLREASEVSNDNPTINFHLAEALAEDSQFVEAERILRRMLAIDEKSSAHEEAQALLEKLESRGNE